MTPRMCKHFNGFQTHAECAKGVRYDSFTQPGIPLFRSLPCLRDEVPVKCELKEPEPPLPDGITPSMLKSPEVGTTWWCDTCGDGLIMTPIQFIWHMNTVHHIDPKTKGAYQMETHMDSATHFTTIWRWTIGDVTAHQSETGLRDKHSPMSYNYEEL